MKTPDQFATRTAGYLAHHLTIRVVVQYTLDALARVLRPGGIITIHTRNGDSLAMRSSFEGRYRDALTAPNADGDWRSIGGTRAHKPEYLLTLLETNSLTPEA